MDYHSLLSEAHASMAALAASHARQHGTTTVDYRDLWERRGERMMAMAAQIASLSHERDMLAERCADQARQIARLLQPDAPSPRDVIGEAIRIHQRQGVR